MRAASSYRARRRNASKGLVWRGIKPIGRKYHPSVRENKRDRTWDKYKKASF
jgi:hypothetical protein